MNFDDICIKCGKTIHPISENWIAVVNHSRLTDKEPGIALFCAPCGRRITILTTEVLQDVPS
jgi:DNA-directed RNA polymerase subunit RPC12/RpoP